MNVVHFSKLISNDMKTSKTKLTKAEMQSKIIGGFPPKYIKTEIKLFRVSGGRFRRLSV